jgi:hypothetical protein
MPLRITSHRDAACAVASRHVMVNVELMPAVTPEPLALNV